MTTTDIFLWIVIPYVSIAIFIVGHIWRYRRDQFRWTSQSTQLLERRLLKWGSPLFHYGALAVIAGHVIGILIPKSATRALGISESTYHFIVAAIPGTIAGLACLLGFLILIYRRAAVRRVAVTTSYVDLLVYALLLYLIVTGDIETVFHNLLAGSSAYDYRRTVSIWFRGVFALQDHIRLMSTVPFVYQLHAVSAWAIIALWPFTRLVHAWSIPLQYIGRPHILYRRRYQTAA
ncbi:MAG TPA: respiratory nitrate reductase subunit gamma [Solirubrobacteraceae bacterium]|nr:respiratory nitrate reductase subunit gamma [Solirubrobacteraceae bacterium]